MKWVIVATGLVVTFVTPRIALAADPVGEEPRKAGLEQLTCESRLAELEQTYARTSDLEVLHDIGRCLADIGDNVRAATTLKHYLDQGGQNIPAEERARVTQWLAEVPSRVARITVSSNVTGVEVRIDGSCAVDEATFEPLCTSREPSRIVLVNPGERRLTVKHAGYRDVDHVMTMSAGENVRVLANAASLLTEINPFREPMWTAWAVTGGLLVGGAVIGIRTAAAREGIDSPTGIATVALGTGALVAAGIATYFTVRAIRWKPTPTTDVAFHVLGLHARF